MRNKLNLKIYRGETFNYVLNYLDSNGHPINLTGCTIVSQCRVKDTNVVLFTFSSTLTNPGTLGELNLVLSAATSLALTPTKNLTYDIKITFPSNEITRWITGDVLLIDTVTS